MQLVFLNPSADVHTAVVDKTHQLLDKLGVAVADVDEPKKKSKQVLVFKVRCLQTKL